MRASQRRVIHRLLDIEDELTEWEYEFVESLATNAEQELTEKQEEILDKLEEKL